MPVGPSKCASDVVIVGNHAKAVTKCRQPRRNAHKAEAARNSLALAALSAPATPGGGAGGGRALADPAALATSATPRDAWVSWLAPAFADNDSAYFTGTYCDEYGESNGLMLPRNVHKDFRRFLAGFDFGDRYIIGVEQHRYRDILHLHAIIEGPYTPEQLLWLKRYWEQERGHARVLPVQDGCASYVTKYALKGDTDEFEWRLS